MATQLSFGRRLLFIALMALFVFLCLEVLLQAFYYTTAGGFLFDRVHPPMCEADPHRCYRMKPDLAYSMRTNEFSTMIYTNSQGLRTDERRLDIVPEKAPDAYRILFLGPSFAFGWGSEWEDTYAALIAEELTVPGKRVELMNLGTPGQGAAPQLCWLREEGSRFSPDAVVVTVYGAQIPPLPSECPEQLECPYISEEGQIYGRKPTLGRRFVAAVKNLATVFYGFYAYQALLPAPAESDAGVGKELYSAEERETDLDSKAIADGYQRYTDFVKQQLGPDTRVAFLHVPLSYVVHPEDAARWSHIDNVSTEDARAKIAAGLEAVRSRGLDIVDTTTPLAQHAEEGRLYYWLDIHLTPLGNRVVADAAVPELQRLFDGHGAPPAPGS